MSSRDLRRFFDARKSDRPGLVLASVYDTLGSTYSKTGDRMLIAADGDFQGMLSGGCLEGDLAERAKQAAGTRECQQVTYDLRRNDEELWGLGVGCEGLMRIFLQPLDEQNDFEPFAAILAIHEGDSVGVAATVLSSSDPETRPGATIIGSAAGLNNFGVSGALEAIVNDAARAALRDDRSTHATVGNADVEAELLCAVVRPSPRILILGGGLDVQPVVRLCAELGWRVTVQDHRPAYIDKGDFSSAEKVLCEPAAELSRILDLERFDAAVVMSHHLVTDRSYLEQLADTSIGYVGLLGPVDRRDRLLDELGTAADRLMDRLHGPAGLDIGGRGPAAIALSIVAQLHEVLIRGRI